MSGEAVRVEGADRLRRTLGQAARSMRDLRPANTAAGDQVERLARTRAPIGATGRLVRSIHATAGPADATIGSGLIYAGPIHNGWPGHNIEPHPFLTDALDAAQPAIAASYTRHLQHVVNNVKGA